MDEISRGRSREPHCPRRGKHVAKGGPAAGDLGVLAAGILSLTLFARRQLGLPGPLLDVRLFKNRAFTAAALTTLMAMLAIGAALFLMSLWLQYVHGYSPFEAGLRTLPAAIATLVGSLLTPWLMEWIGPRAVIALGLGGLVAGFLVLALAPEPTTNAYVTVVLVTLGLGDGLAITTSASVLVSAEPAEPCPDQLRARGRTGRGPAGVDPRRGVRQPYARPQLARESIGDAHELARTAGGRVMDAAQAAFDSALTTTAYVSVSIVGTVTLLVVWLVPRGCKVTAGH
ncbi:MFS transporter [Streptomyces lunaelactis]|uniref:MFS transporter n=1 Tax=Streptomyces lunaelactis TaxID=1535768 RepID=UPI0020C809FC|nr:MFS transporter [Streptomyces lunaelactis]